MDVGMSLTLTGISSGGTSGSQQYNLSQGMSVSISLAVS